jgi:hypothetical protein
MVSSPLGPKQAVFQVARDQLIEPVHRGRTALAAGLALPGLGRTGIVAIDAAGAALAGPERHRAPHLAQKQMPVRRVGPLVTRAGVIRIAGLEPAAKAARAQAGARYDNFVATLGRRLNEAPKLRQEIPEDHLRNGVDMQSGHDGSY